MVPLIAATIRTARRMTASLSDAKNWKTGLRCQAGRADEFEVAMRGGTSCARSDARSTPLRLQPAPVPRLKIVSAGPAFPAFSDRLGIRPDIDLFQAIHSALDRFSRVVVPLFD